MTSDNNSNNVFNSISEEDVYNKINLLIRLPDREFGIICASNKYYNDLCNNSFYSERIFEERTRRLVDNDIIEFKNQSREAMTWKDFYIRLFQFLPIQKELIASNFEYDNTHRILRQLIEENKLMELKILQKIYNKIENKNLFERFEIGKFYFIEKAINYNSFDVLKWLIEENKFKVSSISLIDSIKKNNINLFKYLYQYIPKKQLHSNLTTLIHVAAINNNLDILKFIDLQEGKEILDELYPEQLLSELIYGTNNKKMNLDTLKWLHSRGAILTSQAANEAVRREDLEMLQWIYEHGVRPNFEIRFIHLTPEIENWLKLKNLMPIDIQLQSN